MNEKYDVAVIGSGSGGSEAALLAAEKGSKAILIEKDAFGGTRFHRGCYAVRALHASSRVFRQIIQSRQFGIESDLLRSSLVDWMKAQRAASSRLADDLRNGLQTLNVRIAAGTGSLLSDHQVRITDSLETTKMSTPSISFWPLVRAPTFRHPMARGFSIATI